MPYIREGARDALRRRSPDNAGELNYLFTHIAQEYLNTGVSYQKFNDIIGALEGAKMEMYRRLVAPYEDQKIKENGDVYDTGIKSQTEETFEAKLSRQGAEL